MDTTGVVLSRLLDAGFSASVHMAVYGFSSYIVLDIPSKNNLFSKKLNKLSHLWTYMSFFPRIPPMRFLDEKHRLCYTDDSL